MTWYWSMISLGCKILLGWHTVRVAQLTTVLPKYYEYIAIEGESYRRLWCYKCEYENLLGIITTIFAIYLIHLLFKQIRNKIRGELAWGHVRRIHWTLQWMLIKISLDIPSCGWNNSDKSEERNGGAVHDVHSSVSADCNCPVILRYHPNNTRNMNVNRTYCQISFTT